MSEQRSGDTEGVSDAALALARANAKASTETWLYARDPRTESEVCSVCGVSNVDAPLAGWSWVGCARNARGRVVQKHSEEQFCAPCARVVLRLMREVVSHHGGEP